MERAVLNPANHQIMRQHLVCAAAELPIPPDSELLAGAEARAVLAELRDSGQLLQGAEDGRWFTSRKYPHREVDLRGSGRPFAIRNDLDNTLLGEIDGIRCLKECHPGAVYLHRGRTWVVVNLDLEGREVRARGEEGPLLHPAHGQQGDRDSRGAAAACTAWARRAAGASPSAWGACGSPTRSPASDESWSRVSG